MNEFKEWLALRGSSKHTINQMSADVKRFLRENRDINTRTVQKFVDSQVKAGKDPKTAYSKFLSMRKYCKFIGRELGEIEYPKPKRDVSVIKTLSVREFNEMSRWVRDINKEFGFNHMRDKVIIILLLLGLRRGEMLSLQVEDFDFETEKIKFVGKMEKGAFAPMMNQSKDLMDYLELRNVLPGIEEGNNNFLIYEYNKCYKPLRERELYQILHSLTKRAIGREVNPHTFRHSIATLMLDEGSDIRVIQDTLRHESILTTQVYTHVSKNLVKKALEEVVPLFK